MQFKVVDVTSTTVHFPDLSEDRCVSALCGEAKPLLRSHVVPNAVVRRIKRARGSGQLTQFDHADGAAVRRS